MIQRQKFIEKMLTGRFTVTELARAFEVSRKTAHKWMDRHREGGMAGLENRSHARLTAPDRLSEDVVAEIVDCRNRHPTWGPKKIAATLERERPTWRRPAVSTIGAVLKREGLVKPGRRLAKRQLTRTTWPVPAAPNEEWAADYKGQWRLGDGSLCYPLTLSDSYSRYLLCCDSHTNISAQDTVKSMTAVFSDHGLPAAIRTDRGIPFASHGHRMGLTKLSIWWLKLGIELRRIPPASPTHNARHERMHRVLKAEAMMPYASSQKAQQSRLEAFRHTYNYERPHENLGMQRPAELYIRSPRQMPSKLPDLDYPGHYERYRVRSNGTIALRRRNYFISEALAGEIIGLEQHPSGWKVYLGNYLLADIDDETFDLVYIH